MPFRRSAVTAALLCAGCAKPPASISHEARFAIEIPSPPSHGRPSHVLAFNGGGSSSQIPFSSLIPISWQARSPAAPVTLQLDFSAEGDRARIVSYALYQHGRKKVGDHRARLDQSVELTELRGLGFHPFDLRVLPATPPPRPAPALSSEAPSLQLSVAKENWDTFTIAIHNLSTHAVLAYAIGDRSRMNATEAGLDRRPAIPPGGTLARDEFATGSLTLFCALFDDGTWQGDPAIAAGFKVRLAATEALQRQIDQAAARVLADPSLDDAARVPRIRAAIDALPEELPPALVRKALAGVPVQDLTENQRRVLLYALHNLKWGNSESLTHFQPGGSITLAGYWDLTHPGE
ncbi:MAG TPA: hypothetical protein VMU19_10615 [Bryobacteraceae bacterium]|nr:hypothetical protein [Bryobacteraceae bacterium]